MLKYIGEHQPVHVLRIKSDLGISVGSLYHHLNKLGTFVTQDQHKRYLISKEGRAFLQGQGGISEPINWRRLHDNSELVIDKESLSKYHSTAKLLRFIALNGSVSVKQMKESLDMSVGSIYHHLAKLGHLLEQDEYRRYRLSEEGLTLAGLEVKQERQKEREVPAEVPKEVLELSKAQTEFIPTRVSVLKFLHEKPDSSVARIKDHLNTNKNTVKRHLKRLSKYVARLDMYAQNAMLTGDSRLVSVYIASTSSWRESTLIYQNKPNFSTDPIATVSISSPGWYGWDLTSAVKEKAGSQLTIAVLLQSILNKNQEMVVFTSKEGDPAHAPRLVIDTSAGSSLLDSDYSIRVLGAGITLAVGGGAVGFILYRRRNKQRPIVQASQESSMSSQVPSEETSPEISCPNCGKNVSKDSNICPSCGHELRQTKCASCGKDISMDHQVCPYCGSKINP